MKKQLIGLVVALAALTAWATFPTYPVPIATGGTAATTAAAALVSIGAVAKAGDTMTGALMVGATTNALKISNPPSASGTNLIAANTVSRSDSSNAGYMAVSATSNPIFEGAGYGNATTRFRGYRASGSNPASPAALTGTGGIAQLEAFGHDGVSFESGAGVFLRSSGTWSTSDHRTNIQFLNTLQGTTTLVVSMQVGDLGEITVGPSGSSATHTVNGTLSATTGMVIRGAWGTSSQLNVGGLLFNQLVSVTVANTTSETTALSQTSGLGSVTVPANAATLGRAIYFKAGGVMRCTGTPTATLRFKIGSSSVIAQNLTPGSIDTGGDTESYCDTAAKPFIVDAWCAFRSVGASGVVMCNGGSAQIYSNNKAGGIINFGSTSSATIDTTANQALDFSIQWDTASADNELTIHNAFIEIK